MKKTKLECEFNFSKDLTFDKKIKSDYTSNLKRLQLIQY